MSTQNSINSEFSNNADGFSLIGGTTPRTLLLTAGNVALSAGGSNTYTMPSATDTLVGRASVDTLTNKSISAASNTFTFGTSSQANAGTGGGTMYYINLGGVKMLWMQTTASTATTTYTITFPTSFFSTVQSVTAGYAGQSGTTTGAYIVISSISTTGFSYYSGTNPATGSSFMIMGT